MTVENDNIQNVAPRGFATPPALRSAERQLYGIFENHVATLARAWERQKAAHRERDGSYDKSENALRRRFTWQQPSGVAVVGPLAAESFPESRAGDCVQINMPIHLG
jgi:hypothetical protein